MSATPPVASPAGPAVSAGGTSLWKEYKNPEGRPYWFHSVEKRSVWEKPDELKTPREKAIASTKWKEYKSGERSYYVHSETKETTWQVPQELKDVLALLTSSGEEDTTATASSSRTSAAASARSNLQSVSSKSPGTASTPAPGPAPGPPPIAPSQLGVGGGGPPRPIYSGPPPGFGAAPGPPPTAPAAARMPPSGPAAMSGPPPPTDPAAMSVSSGPGPLSSPEEAFKHLLRSKGVTVAWSWEQTMRHIITDPLYKSLKSLAERKAVYAEYQADLRKQEDQQRVEKKLAVKPAVVALLKAKVQEGQLKEYSSWRTVLKLFGEAEEIKSAIEAIGSSEASTFWQDVQKELKSASELSTREVRHRNMDLLMSLLRTFETDTTTRWKDAHRTILESTEWKQDAHLSSMDLGDMLIVFEEYMRSIEREESERRKEEEKQRARAERKRRQAFRELMSQGRREGWVHSGATWPAVFDRLKKDERLTEMLGQRGSTPLEIFFDALDICDRSIEARTAAVESLIRLSEPQWEGVREGTTWQHFVDKIHAGLAASRGTDQEAKWETVAQEDAELKTVFDTLLTSAERTARDARKRHERRVRHLIDDARYGLKKDVDDDLLRLAESEVPYADVAERIESLSIREWRKLDEGIEDASERAEVKKITWEKFCRRQKEKAEERRSVRGSSRPLITSAPGGSTRSSEVGETADRANTITQKRKGDADGPREDGERERDRARRREDRDRRRGGRDDADEELRREVPSRRPREEGEGGIGANSSSYRVKRRKGDTPPPTKSAVSTLVSRSGGGGGGGGDDGDDDKEEGEV